MDREYIESELKKGFEGLLSLRGQRPQIEDSIQINPEDIQVEVETTQ